jgi:penicillin-binding protein 2
MFERRLKIVLALPALAGVIFAGRLFELQVLRGGQYADRAEASLLAPRHFLPPLRGRIVDRFGRTLVSDEPAHDLTVHYAALKMDDADLLRIGRGLMGRAAVDPLPGERPEDLARRCIAETWSTIERVGDRPPDAVRQMRDDVCRAVENLRRYIWRKRKAGGYDEPLEALRLREQDEFHPVLSDLSPPQRTQLEIAFSHLPFVRIEPSVRRVWSDRAAVLCHVLGRLGQVSAERIEADPLGDDALARYRPGDRAGVSGVELLGEDMLRGKRGAEERFLDDRLSASTPPIDGLDVQLTIDLDLQEAIVRILEEAVAACPTSAGASCVVLDIDTREILALVSVPTFDAHALKRRYASLRDDARSVPLRLRAVAEEYQPGSIIKPVALLAGRALHVVSPAQRVFCDGSLIPGADKWHCWTFWRGMAGHGEISSEEAIQHSCNVYFYTLGQRVRADRLTDFYRRFLFGGQGEDADQVGTGLIEERDGLIPSRQWMGEHRHRDFRKADGRNYAIGQGEIQITPLQAANMFATLAAGCYQSPTLIAIDGRLRPEIPIEGPAAADWSLVRRGLYRCVSEQGGTAHRYVFMDGQEICGKTGSAQCVSRITKRRYTFESPDGGEPRSIVAPTIENAREALELPSSAKCSRRDIVERWPPRDPKKGEPPTHAWFAGFAPYRNPRIALAVIIEYGGSGGATAGPAAKAIFQSLMDSPHGYLPQGGAVANAGPTP